MSYFPHPYYVPTRNNLKLVCQPVTINHKKLIFKYSSSHRKKIAFSSEVSECKNSIRMLNRREKARKKIVSTTQCIYFKAKTDINEFPVFSNVFSYIWNGNVKKRRCWRRWEQKHRRRKRVTHHKGVSDVERPTYKEMRIVSLKSS